MPKKSSKSKKASKGNKKWQSKKRQPAAPAGGPGDRVPLHQPLGHYGPSEFEKVNEGSTAELAGHVSYSYDMRSVEDITKHTSDNVSSAEHYIPEIIQDIFAMSETEYNTPSNFGSFKEISESIQHNIKSIEDLPESNPKDKKCVEDISEHKPENVNSVEYILEITKDNEGSIEDIPESNQGAITIEEHTPDSSDSDGYKSKSMQENENAVEDMPESIQQNKRNTDDLPENNPDDKKCVEDISEHKPDNVNSVEYILKITKDNEGSIEDIPESNQGAITFEEHTPDSTDIVGYKSKSMQENENGVEDMPESIQQNKRSTNDLPENNPDDKMCIEDIFEHKPDNINSVDDVLEIVQDNEGSIEDITESNQSSKTIEEYTLDNTGIVGHKSKSMQENESSVEDVPDSIYNERNIGVESNPENVNGVCENTPYNKCDDDEDDLHNNLTSPGSNYDSFSSCSDFSNYSDCETVDESLCLEQGSGVCVVSAHGGAAGQQFRLQREALAALLARPGVAERPAVVVSVAGAFRGGKSFLLDFMLRYLYAQAGASGAPGEDWLGGEREPLRGFSWRNGSARDTTGLVLWSQPVPVTLPSGEQVVVLLMDTQGAFDEQSSLHDCSLVFALSTLLASVQIYNVSRRLDESDLQHLQLFTDYAALGGGGLQELRVLVRDWSAPYEHPYGAAGGAAYLRDKLQVKKQQPRESREIRQRLASSFERVGCFLLPHPGLKAACDPNFRGHLGDVTEEFKQSLQELVPLILAPENLRVKTVDGRPLRAGELAVFLEAYLDEFRDRVPSPQTALSATAKARWLTAAAAARAALCAPPPRRALPRAGLRARLAAALQAALAPLAPLAERAGETAALARLEQELDELLARQIDANARTVELAAARAREVFERAARALQQDERLCVHPRDLAPALEAVRDAARDRFCEDVESDDDDPELTQLTIELEERCKWVLRRLRAVNSANNVAGVAAARAALAGALASRPCAAAADLAAAHAAARAAAAAAFADARSAPSTHPDDDDPYLTQLEHEINDFLRNHEEQNKRNNAYEVNEALRFYDRSIDLDLGCWKPEELSSKHKEEQSRAKERFYGRRQGPNRRERDVYIEELERGLQYRFNNLQRLNEHKNQVAIEAAFQVFSKTMYENFKVLKHTPLELDEKLNAAFESGNQEFLNRSVSSRSRHDIADQYLCTLQQRMRDKFAVYREKNEKKLTGGEVGLMVGTAAGALALGALGAAGGVGGLLLGATRLFR